MAHHDIEYGPFIEGYAAWSGSLAEDAKLNPYHEGSDDYDAWWCGWYQADDDESNI